ncbi:MAG: hypothetical protein ACI4SB_04845 [Acutalibacteraceae bacterium]
MNIFSALKATICLLRCGHFLYTAKRIVSVLTVIVLICTAGLCLCSDKKLVKRLSSKIKAVMK